MKKAFTLIELLLVIAVVSLLTSIILTNLSETKEKAALAAISSEAQDFRTAIELYRSHNDGKYPHEQESVVANLGSTTYYRIKSDGSISKFPANFDLASGITNIKPFISSLKKPDHAIHYGYASKGLSYSPACKNSNEMPKFIIFFLLEKSENNNYSEVEYRDNITGNVVPGINNICTGTRRINPADTSGIIIYTNKEFGCYAICYY